jgi:tetratricopeptide (TPR) repeat protein
LNRWFAYLVNAHLNLGQYEEALAAGARGLEIANRSEDLKLRLLTTTYLVVSHHGLGNYQRAVELGTDNIRALPSDWMREHLGNAAFISVHDRWGVCNCLAQLGRFEEGIEHAQEAIRIAEPTGHVWSTTLAYAAAGGVYLTKGDWATARPLLERQIALSAASGFKFFLSLGTVNLALVLAALGEYDEALRRLVEGEGLIARRGPQGGSLYRNLARAALLLGRIDDAQRLGVRAMEQAHTRLGEAAHARKILADIAMHPDRFDRESAESSYRAALALAEPRGMRPLVAHCHAGLAKLYRRTDKHQQADEHLAAATTMYRDMGMTYWLEKAEAEMRELG